MQMICSIFGSLSSVLFQRMLHSMRRWAFFILIEICSPIFYSLNIFSVIGFPGNFSFLAILQDSLLREVMVTAWANFAKWDNYERNLTMLMKKIALTKGSETPLLWTFTDPVGTGLLWRKVFHIGTYHKLKIYVLFNLLHQCVRNRSLANIQLELTLRQDISKIKFWHFTNHFLIIDNVLHKTFIKDKPQAWFLQFPEYLQPTGTLAWDGN